MITVNRSDLTPAMLGLTEMQQRFVVALVEVGGNQTRAALLAGYKNGSGLTGTASVLASDPRVQAALHEVSLGRLHGGKVLAVSKLVELCDSNDEKVAMKAALAIMDRTGLHATSEHHVKTEDKSKTDEAMIERILQLSRKLKLDPQLLLGQAGIHGEIVDGEFVVVQEAPAATEEWETAE